MKKTKFLCGLLAMALVLSLASCSNSSGGGGNSNSTPYTKVSTQTIGETTYDIVTFGSFPQSEKTDDTISVDETDSKSVGSFTYYKGSDGEWYANLNSKYYKVEPIKWRVLTENYDHDNNTSTPGKKLLLAENILINCMYYDYHNVNRTIGNATIYPNNYEHSRIRAYLNGLSYQKKASDSAQESDNTLAGKGFFQTAFTTQEQSAIVTTKIVNNEASANPDSNLTEFDNGNNQYASNTPTEDKIFLLSEQEATKADYGFAAYNASGAGNTRIRMTTAFAKANGANGSTSGFWWLRSPSYKYSNCARNVLIDGHAGGSTGVTAGHFGVVPALCLN